VPDICDLILDDHELFRRRFAEMDELRASGTGTARVAAAWKALGDHLDLHAAAEEELFYPELLDVGKRSEEETEDAITDHNEIRDAVRKASQSEPGSQAWWQAISDARKANSDHMAEEERGALADFRLNASPSVREDLGGRWLQYQAEHSGVLHIDRADKDADSYIASHKG
jgi:hypothetical protein